MCGILGFVGPNTAATQQMVRQLMLHLSLRGTHATGLAVLVNHQLRTISMPVDARTFLERVTLDSPMCQSGELKLIAHTRYSTSDLRWNQPVTDGYTALVMNGVISQEPPERWPFPWDGKNAVKKYETGNDAEVALRFAGVPNQRGHMPGSWAICELEINGSLLVYRNGYRPLWAACGPDQSWRVVSSTADSLLRCGLRPFLLTAGVVTDIGSAPVKTTDDCFPVSDDLQPGLNSLWPDLQCHV